MNTHFDLSDVEFKKQIKDRTLNPSLFNHEAHLRLAWIYNSIYNQDKASEIIVCQIFDYVEHLGATSKFNKTLTIAAVKIVDHFMQKSTVQNFKDFLKEFPRLKDSFIELIRAHYSFDIFQDDNAKKNYIEPDILPFT